VYLQSFFYCNIKQFLCIVFGWQISLNLFQVIDFIVNMGNNTTKAQTKAQTNTQTNTNSPSTAVNGINLPEDLYDCTICYDKIQPDNISTTKCNHYFCKTCLDAWLAINTTCPMCRTVIRERIYVEPRLVPRQQPQPRVEVIPAPRREIVTRNIMERYTWEQYFMASNDLKQNTFIPNFDDINKSDYAPAFADDNLLGW
jgi:hypothetical protein